MHISCDHNVSSTRSCATLSVHFSTAQLLSFPLLPRGKQSLKLWTLTFLISIFKASICRSRHQRSSCLFSLPTSRKICTKSKRYSIIAGRETTGSTECDGRDARPMRRHVSRSPIYSMLSGPSPSICNLSRQHKWLTDLVSDPSEHMQHSKYIYI